jgi:hypothetical protein
VLRRPVESALRPSIGVQQAAGHVNTFGLAARDGVIERSHGDP